MFGALFRERLHFVALLRREHRRVLYIKARRHEARVDPTVERGPRDASGVGDAAQGEQARVAGTLGHTMNLSHCYTVCQVPHHSAYPTSGSPRAFFSGRA